MTKAVITIGSKQYLVSEGDELEVNRLKDAKELSFMPQLVIDEAAIKVGKPNVEGVTVSIKILEPEMLGDKVLAIRYKAKKRVNKVRGHRQKLSRIKITKISSSK